MVHNPTSNEPSTSNSVLGHGHCRSPEPTLSSNTSDSDNASPQPFRLPPEKQAGSSQCNYQPINPHSTYFSDADVESDEESKPSGAAPIRGARRVRFHSRTLVNPKATSSILKEIFPSPSSSVDSLHTHSHPSLKDEDLEAGLKDPYLDPATYTRTLPHVPGPEQLKPAANPPPERIRDVFPLWRFLAFLGRRIKRAATRDYEEKVPTKRRKRNPYIAVESCVPLQIWLVLSRYVLLPYPP